MDSKATTPEQTAADDELSHRAAAEDATIESNDPHTTPAGEDNERHSVPGDNLPETPMSPDADNANEADQASSPAVTVSTLESEPADDRSINEEQSDFADLHIEQDNSNSVNFDRMSENWRTTTSSEDSRSVNSEITNDGNKMGEADAIHVQPELEAEQSNVITVEETEEDALTLDDEHLTANSKTDTNACSSSEAITHPDEYEPSANDVSVPDDYIGQYVEKETTVESESVEQSVQDATTGKYDSSVEDERHNVKESPIADSVAEDSIVGDLAEISDKDVTASEHDNSAQVDHPRATESSISDFVADNMDSAKETVENTFVGDDQRNSESPAGVEFVNAVSTENKQHIDEESPIENSVAEDEIEPPIVSEFVSELVNDASIKHESQNDETMIADTIADDSVDPLKYDDSEESESKDQSIEFFEQLKSDKNIHCGDDEPMVVLDQSESFPSTSVGDGADEPMDVLDQSKSLVDGANEPLNEFDQSKSVTETSDGDGADESMDVFEQTKSVTETSVGNDEPMDLFDQSKSVNDSSVDDDEPTDVSDQSNAVRDSAVGEDEPLDLFDRLKAGISDGVDSNLRSSALPLSSDDECDAADGADGGDHNDNDRGDEAIVEKSEADSFNDDGNVQTDESMIELVALGSDVSKVTTELDTICAADEPNEPIENLTSIRRCIDADAQLTLLPDDFERTITDEERTASIDETIALAGETLPTTESPAEIDVQFADDDSDPILIGDDPDDRMPVTSEIRELSAGDGNGVEQRCAACSESLLCRYDFVQDTKHRFLCTDKCVDAFICKHPAYKRRPRRKIICFVAGTDQRCRQCDSIKNCVYRVNLGDPEAKTDADAAANPDTFAFWCSDDCLNAHLAEYPDAFDVKRSRHTIDELPADDADVPRLCIRCRNERVCRFAFVQHADETAHYLCSSECVQLLLDEHPTRYRLKSRKPESALPVDVEEHAPATGLCKRSDNEVAQARIDREQTFKRNCAQCQTAIVQPSADSEAHRSLHWQLLDFCNEHCLGEYQQLLGSACVQCSGPVSRKSMGKHALRFGGDVRQFCRARCVNAFKRTLKVCRHCQTDISLRKSTVLAKVGERLADFCDRQCLRMYADIMQPERRAAAGPCSVCKRTLPTALAVAIEGQPHRLCSTVCLNAFGFANNIQTDRCEMCRVYGERRPPEAGVIFAPNLLVAGGDVTDRSPLLYCSTVCQLLYVQRQRRVVRCDVCAVSKYDSDMIQRYDGRRSRIAVLCSLECLSMGEMCAIKELVNDAQCDGCGAIKPTAYQLTLSDARVRRLCSYECALLQQTKLAAVSPVANDDEPSLALTPTVTLTLRPTAKSGRVVAVGAVDSPSAPDSAEKPQTVRAVKTTDLLNATPTKSLLAPRTLTMLTRRSAAAANPVQPTLKPLSPPPLAQIPRSRRQKKPAASPTTQQPSVPAPAVEIRSHIITVPPLPARVQNMSTQCRPQQRHRGSQCRPPATASVACQTESHLERRYLIAVPVPIFIPQPMHMYSLPTPIPVPIPLPIPVPVFIPTTRNSAAGIMKEIKKIQDKLPIDPLEAELLMMAEMVSGADKSSADDSDSDDDVPLAFAASMGASGSHPAVQAQPTDLQNRLPGEASDEILQLALNMVQDYDAGQPVVDLESSMSPSTITGTTLAGLMVQQQQQHMMQPGAHGRNRKRSSSPSRSAAVMVAAVDAMPTNSPLPLAKRPRLASESPAPISVTPAVGTPPPPVDLQQQPLAEKPDANMCLKFTFGVNAWKQWAVTKNAEYERSSYRRKPFSCELLQLTADELNYSLCMFVREVRKPNGSEYAPDTVYYLVLGIQQYLYEHGRIDNIFTDPYYEKFTDCLDDVARKFSVLYNDSQYIVTRVEEEHLWECKQLGAHSPHVLLSTLMFFNTKHFNLTTIEDHANLSFSHIMKHWKRTPPNSSNACKERSRNVMLRFYPPQSALEGNSRKKKVYEQQENEDNPLRCPVKLYEFYLSKCPESVKTRNDVFYLQPERSCVPDSPVWYSTQSLSTVALTKMLHRVKMVKEINIALLTS